MQLKLEHGYFKSYLKRLPDYDSDKCDCDGNSTQSPAHLLLNCGNLAIFHHEMKLRLQKSLPNMQDLFCFQNDIQLVCEFLERSHIARKN